MKKLVYIAHPVSGNIKSNLESIIKIGRDINLNDSNVIPFVPYFFDLQCLDDNIPNERNKGIENNSHYFNSSIIDELWLYGKTISRGMNEEIKLALKNDIPVIPKTEETKIQLKQLQCRHHP